MSCPASNVHPFTVADHLISVRYVFRSTRMSVAGTDETIQLPWTVYRGAWRSTLAWFTVFWRADSVVVGVQQCKASQLICRVLRPTSTPSQSLTILSQRNVCFPQHQEVCCWHRRNHTAAMDSLPQHVAFYISMVYRFSGKGLRRVVESSRVKQASSFVVLSVQRPPLHSR